MKAMNILFGEDHFKISFEALGEIPDLLRSRPGRVLQLNPGENQDRISWHLFYSDGAEIYCGFRKSVSATYHFFKLNNLLQDFESHCKDLATPGYLRFRRKSKGSKGKGSRKNSTCLLGFSRQLAVPTIARRIKFIPERGYKDLEL